MVVAEDPQLSWAITKALLIVCVGFGAVLHLAWIAAKKTLPK
jgi:hypothetical protein